LATVTRKAHFPRQIRYIVGNEACERFSYYGMRSILVIFMTQYLFMKQNDAVSVYHLFISANYFLTLFGGYVADRFWGKYRTIFWLSLVYCAGHAVLALFESKAGMYWGLGLISLGSGGIKPCVSAFVGDQFDDSNQSLLPKVFDIFYWSINFGSFFSSLLIPWVLPTYGPKLAFGIPGILMGVATLIFWLGRRHYAQMETTQKEGSKFLSVLWYSITHLGDRRPGSSWLDVARAKFDAEKVEGAKAAVSIFTVFISVAAFWSLYDQQGSTWVLQAEQMNRHLWGMTIESSQIQALNPILVMILIPVFSLGVYPLIEKLGIKMTPLRKMSGGMVIAALSFAFVGLCQAAIDSGHTLNVAWQFIPYVLITVSEVMVSITGLEFAYTQAPKAMKSTIMSLWLLTVAVGDFLDSFISYLNRFSGAGEFYFYTGLMFLVALIFIACAMRYKEHNYVSHAVAAG
jgi:POT family proton-dependent oligopeptide transporter